MTRIGMVGGRGGSTIFHGIAFAALLNERDKEAWAAAGFWDPGVPRIEDAQIVAIWDSDRAAAEKLASMLPGVEVVDDAKDLVGPVDGILIVDDTTQKHQEFATPFLRAGVPLFVDKPLSRETGEAKHIIETAEAHGVPFMSSSALRFARELEEARGRIEEIGPIQFASAIGPGELIFYGVHPTELFHAALGPGVEKVTNLGREGCAFVKVDYADGRYVFLSVSEGISYGFRLTLYGAKGWVQIDVSDAAYFYKNMLEHAIAMFRTSEEPIPLSSTLEVIKILHGAKRSLEIGEPVRLAEL